MCASAAIARCCATRRSSTGWPAPNAMRVTPEEMAAAWEAHRSGAARCADDGGRADSRICRAANAGIVERSTRSTGLTTGQLVRPLGSVGLLCAERTASAAFDAADDGDSRAGGGRGAHCRGLAQACAGDAGGGASCSGSRSSIASVVRTRWRRWRTERRALPRVDKIVGPGNLYVTAAKRLVAFDCAIDMLAGPTEIVVTSERGNAAELRAISWRRRARS